jgi:hypothetical protein
MDLIRMSFRLICPDLTCFLFMKRHTISDSWITRLQINLIAGYLRQNQIYIRKIFISRFLRPTTTKKKRT